MGMVCGTVIGAEFHKVRVGRNDRFAAAVPRGEYIVHEYPFRLSGMDTLCTFAGQDRVTKAQTGQAEHRTSLVGPVVMQRDMGRAQSARQVGNSAAPCRGIQNRRGVDQIGFAPLVRDGPACIICLVQEHGDAVRYQASAIQDTCTDTCATLLYGDPFDAQLTFRRYFEDTEFVSSIDGYAVGFPEQSPNTAVNFNPASDHGQR